MVQTDATHGIIGQTHPTEGDALGAWIAAYNPFGVFDTGDCKDGYGAANTNQLDMYREHLRWRMPWVTLNAGFNAQWPTLPGNHDEVDDYNTVGSVSDFSPFTSKFWSPPFHWSFDWPAPKVRVIALHTYIQHTGGIAAGLAHIDTTEINFLTSQLASLPTGWCAIVCSHFPANPAFGDYVNFIDNTYEFAGPSTLANTLAANAAKIPCYLNGHRHDNMTTNTLNGIVHIDGCSTAYTLNNGSGGFVPIKYDSAARTLTFDYLYAHSAGAFTRYAGFTPIVVTLP